MTIQSLVLAAASRVPGSLAGAVVFAVVFAVVLLLGIAKCTAIAKRETTNAKCVHSLMLFLLLLLLIVIGGAARSFDGEVVHAPAFRLVMGSLLLLLVVAAITMAVLGLVELRANPGKFRQGRAQAVWTLTLVGLWVGASVWGWSHAGRTRTATGHEVGVGEFPDAQTYAFREFNCQVAAPRGWARLEAAHAGPLVKLFLMRTRPQVFFALVPERLGIDSGVTREALAEIVHAGAASRARSAQLGTWTPDTIGGFTGLQATSRLRIGETDVFFDHWVGVRGGFGYGLTCWSDARVCSRDELERRARDVRSGFRQIALDWAIHSAGPPAPAVWRSERFGGTLRLAAGWFLWGNLATECPEAAFGALGEANALVVVPIALAPPVVDARYVAEALLGCLNIEPSEAGLSVLRRVARGGFERLEYQHAREIDGVRFQYRIRCLVGKRTAFMVAAWAEEGKFTEADMWAWLDGFSASPGHRPSGEDRWTDADRERHAGVFARLAATLGASRPGDAAAHLQRVVEWQPTRPEHHLALLQALATAGRFEDVIRATERALEIHAGTPSLQSFRPFARAHTGEKAAAVEEYEALFRAGHRDIQDLRLYADVMLELGRGEAATRLMETLLTESSSRPVRIVLVHLLAQLGDVDLAIAELKRVQAEVPSDDRLDWVLMAIYEDADRDLDALRLAQQLIERGHDAAKAYSSKARAEMKLGWYRKAKETLQAACAEFPTARALQAMLDTVNGVLGEGSNRLLRRVIDPVPIPDSLLAPPTISAADLERVDAVYESSVVAIHFVPGQEFRKTTYVVVRALTQAGVAQCNSLQFSFDPLAAEVHVNRVLVRDAKAREVARGKLADYYVLDDVVQGTATEQKRLHVPVSGLAVGHTVEVVVTTRRLGKPREMPYEALCLAGAYPTARSSVVVRGDRTAVESSSSPGLTPTEDGGALCWSVAWPPAMVAEPHQPAYERFAHMVWVGSPTASWADVVHRYLARIADRLEPDAVVAETASRVTAGLESAEDKALALAEFVQGELTYQAIAFGARAQVPDPAHETLVRRYGDCKDHALLLHLLLRAAGVRSCLALLNTSSPIVESLPSIDQFDHAVVYCPDCAGGRTFDCTAKYLDQRVSIPLGLGGRRVLLLDDAAPRFTRVPAYPVERWGLSIKRAIRLSRGRRAHVRDTVTFDAYLSSLMRSYLTGESDEQRLQAVQRSLDSVLPGATVDALEIEGLSALDHPLVIRCEYAAPNVLHPAGDDRVGRIPAGWARHTISVEHQDRRVTPCWLPYPVKIDVETQVTAPEGMRFASVDAEKETSSKGPFGRFRTTVATEDSHLRVRALLQRDAGLFPAADFVALSDYVERALSTIEFGFSLER